MAIFYPSGQRARDLKKETDLALLGSLAYLLGLLQDGAKEDVAAEIRLVSEAARQVRAANGRQVSCMIYAFHDSFLNAMRRQDVVAAKSLALELGRFTWISEEPEVVPFRSEQHSLAEWKELEATLSSAYLAEYRQHFSLCAPSHDMAMRTSDIIDQALARISAMDSESYDEFRALVTHVVLLRTDGIAEGTCFNALGCIYLSAAEKYHSWAHFVDMLIHETAHHVLYAYWSRESLILNDRQGLYDSPFRAEKRPLSGIYHAMCVLARTIRIFRILEHSSDCAPAIKKYYSLGAGVKGLEKEFLDAHGMINRYAELSDLGKKIMDEAYEMVMV